LLSKKIYKKDMPNKLVNIIEQAIKKKRGLVLGRKIKRRLKRIFNIEENDKHEKWIEDKSEEYKKLLRSTDKKLWSETQNFKNKTENRAKKIFSSIDVKLGGGGAYDLLYFITRLTKPSCVVETGVAAGFSSVAFLEAMDRNNHGHLYSSDFPYFRIDNPEKYIGILVTDKLKNRWNLYVEGDKHNLPIIKEQIKDVDIFHYDSDKSYEGREYAYGAVKDHLHDESIVMYDDIEDNTHFYNLNQKLEKRCRVFEFENKHVGLLGSIK